MTFCTNIYYKKKFSLLEQRSRRLNENMFYLWAIVESGGGGGEIQCQPPVAVDVVVVMQSSTRVELSWVSGEDAGYAGRDAGSYGTWWGLRQATPWLGTTRRGGLKINTACPSARANVWTNWIQDCAHKTSWPPGTYPPLGGSKPNPPFVTLLYLVSSTLYTLLLFQNSFFSFLIYFIAFLLDYLYSLSLSLC